MTRKRHQKGHIHPRHGYWWLRYRVPVRRPDGSAERKHLDHRLAPICKQYRTKSSVQPLAEEFLLEINGGHYNVDSTMTLRAFVEQVYFPEFAKQNWKPSSFDSDCWRWRKIVPLCGDTRLRDFQPQDGQQLIEKLAAKGDLSRGSLQRTRSLLSSIFSEAKRRGLIGNVPNPMQAVRIPTRPSKPLPAPRQTHAYTLAEIKLMLPYLPDPDRTLVAVVAFTGIRPGELTALEWPDWKDGHLQVWKSDWEGHVTQTKTGDRREIPVVKPLAQILMGYWQRCGEPTSGRIFHHKGKRVSLKNRARKGRVLRQVLANRGIDWHDWYAFRRGLASNLKELGIETNVIQAILGHRNPRTTENHYIKTRQPQIDAAMEKLGSALMFTELCTEQ